MTYLGFVVLGSISTPPGFLPLFLATPLVLDALVMAGLGTLGAGPRAFDEDSLDGASTGMTSLRVALGTLGAGPKSFDEDLLDGPG